LRQTGVVRKGRGGSFPFGEKWDLKVRCGEGSGWLREVPPLLRGENDRQASFLGKSARQLTEGSWSGGIGLRAPNSWSRQQKPGFGDGRGVPTSKTSTCCSTKREVGTKRARINLRQRARDRGVGGYSISAINPREGVSGGAMKAGLEKKFRWCVELMGGGIVRGGMWGPSDPEVM